MFFSRNSTHITLGELKTLFHRPVKFTFLDRPFGDTETSPCYGSSLFDVGPAGFLNCCKFISTAAQEYPHDSSVPLIG